jgi:hypothetical protein
MNEFPPLPVHPEESLTLLDPSGLTNLLVADEDRVPRNVIEHCARRGDAMADCLAEVLENDWGETATLGEWWLRLHAVMILGLIPTERSGLLLVEFMRRMAREQDDDLQDWLSGNWPALFANKPDSVAPALRALGEDRGLDWYIRCEALDAWIAGGERQGGEALEEALAWAAGIASEQSEDWDVRLHAGSLLLDFPRERYRPLVQDLAKRQTASDRYFSEEEVEKAYAEGKDSPLWANWDDPWDFYSPEEIARRQERWEEEEARADQEPGFDDVPEIPYIREIPKVGRNDPCPCGSGKKYKKCCLKEEASESPDDLLWHRMRRLLEGLPARLLNFSQEMVGRRGIEEAWGDFGLEEIEPFNTDSPHLAVFTPWFFHHWMPDPAKTALPRSALDGLTVTGAFLRAKGRHLDPLLVRYLESCIGSPFSFHEVVRSRPGRGFLLRDILTGEQQEVTERSASGMVQAGDILFAQVVGVNALRMMEASGSVVIPPLRKQPVIELRARLRESGQPLTADAIRDRERELIAVYLELAGRLLHPRMPALQNTDGDPLLFHRLIYDLESPRAAFDALKDLCITETGDELLAAAELDASGELRKVEFSWQKPGNAKNKEWTNTVLGHITIEGNKLAAEVNSENRAKRFQALIAERLGGRARYKTTVLESPQAMLARAREEPETEAARRRREEQEALNALPEVQEQLTRMLRAHYERWVEEKIPALGDRTPLEAMKTPDGREMVEALLAQAERDGARARPPLDPSILAELRARLGLLK